MAVKIENYIYYKASKLINRSTTLTDKEIPYAELSREVTTFQRDRQEGEIIHIEADPNSFKNDPLSRSIYGQVLVGS